MRVSPGRAGRKAELQLGTAHACARTRGAVIPEGSPRIRLCSHTLAVISSHHKSPIVARMSDNIGIPVGALTATTAMFVSTLLGSFVKVRSCGRCIIPKVLRRRCSGCWQQWAKRKAVWLGGNGVDMLLLSLLHQNFDGWVGLLNRWNDWKKLQKSEYSPIFIFSSRCLSTEPCPWLSYLIGVKQTQNFALSGVLIRRNSP
ncbi:hypothetical protein QYF61_001691 [Mycteria americana]|uniref:Uncharacterized protein n=1 Tax=Mycteria americana TaxID=33587 RepID=A0AAN7NTU8_MYCAM|nr:hypothetical protein QYF61_001691 [Mycteria americana]